MAAHRNCRTGRDHGIIGGFCPNGKTVVLREGLALAKPQIAGIDPEAVVCSGLTSNFVLKLAA